MSVSHRLQLRWCLCPAEASVLPQSEVASDLGLEKLKEDPREVVAAEGLPVGLAVSPHQGETAD